MNIYHINEIFYSVQGEGVRAGTANVFIRFAGCNLQCNGEWTDDQFQPVCDTEFVSSVKMTAEDIVTKSRELGNSCKWVILTGGEPMLQVDDELIKALKQSSFRIAVETNGTRPIPHGIDWLCVSPKTAEHTLVVKRAEEVKYVRHAGQGIPKPSIEAPHYLISPAFESDGTAKRETLEACIRLVKENPEWRLSVQQHKSWRIR